MSRPAFCQGLVFVFVVVSFDNHGPQIVILYDHRVVTVTVPFVDLARRPNQLLYTCVIPLFEWAPCFAECFAGLEGLIIGGLERSMDDMKSTRHRAVAAYFEC